MEDNNSATAKKISFFFVAIVSVLLILSFISLYQAVETYRTTGSPDYITVLMSASAITLSFYMVLQLRRKPLKLGFEVPKVITTVQCTSCDFTNTREFQGGDYILKQAEPCPKCNSSTFVSSIYREPEPTEEEE